ncbi:hypothetical protein ABEB36_004877 [Hypothenemus hampei]|uniref:Uncharacterized protein n=1 Tax=Hypothenemus hampei TaxID=57062 RepID=A0ABD1EX62_HYPHA
MGLETRMNEVTCTEFARGFRSRKLLYLGHKRGMNCKIALPLSDSKSKLICKCTYSKWVLLFIRIFIMDYVIEAARGFYSTSL